MGNKSENISTAIVAKAVEKQAAPIFKSLAQLSTIRNQTDCDLALSLVKQLKGLLKEADAKECKITDPLEEAIEEVKKLFTPFKSQVKSTEANIKNMIVEFVERNKLAEKKIEEKAAEGKIGAKAYTNAMAKIVPVKGSRTIQTVEIVNEDLIPREYLIPDMVKIKLAMKDGKFVKGCKWSEKTSIAI